MARRACPSRARPVSEAWAPTVSQEPERAAQPPVATRTVSPEQAEPQHRPDGVCVRPTVLSLLPRNVDGASAHAPATRHQRTVLRLAVMTVIAQTTCVATDAANGQDRGTAPKTVPAGRMQTRDGPGRSGKGSANLQGRDRSQPIRPSSRLIHVCILRHSSEVAPRPPAPAHRCHQAQAWPDPTAPSTGAGHACASRISFSRARSLLVARRVAAAITGAMNFANPLGPPRLRSLMRVPPPSSVQV
jgi:hypothetical protein